MSEPWCVCKTGSICGWHALHPSIPAPQPSQPVELKIPEDLSVLWDQAFLDLGRPFRWMRLTPTQVVSLIERIARLEQKG